MIKILKYMTYLPQLLFSMEMKIETRTWVALEDRRGKPAQEGMLRLVTMKSSVSWVLLEPLRAVQNVP